jgi:hypothetical protein
MTPYASLPKLGAEFDDFLYAPVGDMNGMTVSVLSALARAGVDPWQEAAALARLPGASAIERLTSLLAALPDAIAANPGTIAARLIPLLSRRTGRATAPPETTPMAGPKKTRLPNLTVMVLMGIILVALMLAAQWLLSGP